MSISRVMAEPHSDTRRTVKLDLHTDADKSVSAIVHEDLDGGKSVHNDLGVLTTLRKINEKIGPALVAQNFDVTRQQEIDQFMLALDGTDNKNVLGANAILGVSLAVCKAGAVRKGLPLYKYIAELAGIDKVILPVPAFNVINGGSYACKKLAVQEFMILPVGAQTFAEAMRMGSDVYHHLKTVIQKRRLDATVGNDGAYAPNIKKDKEGLDLLKSAIEKAGYTGKIKIGLRTKRSQKQARELVKHYKWSIEGYPVVSIEDGFDQDDWEHWGKFMGRTDLQLVGDDLTVTNPKRIQTAIDKKSCNCLLLKVNQIGSVTESIEAATLSRKNGWGVMVSHRSGETEDTFIADLVVGLAAGQIKTGAPCRSELPKYERFKQIEEELGSDAVYAGVHFRNPQGK
ncbi:unnamed protein product, partial [Mesorhabditis spiculigera]